MNWDEFDQGVREAESTMRAADSRANRLAGLLSGRLRKVGECNLKKLKRELSQFNARTGSWKT